MRGFFGFCLYFSCCLFLELFVEVVSTVFVLCIPVLYHVYALVAFVSLSPIISYIV